MIRCIRVEANGDIRVPYEFAFFESDPADATPGVAEIRDDETGEVTAPASRGGDGWLHPNKGRWAKLIDAPDDQPFDPQWQSRSRTIPTHVSSGPVVVTYEVADLPLEPLRVQAKADVDAAAEAFRLGFITAGAGQAMTYQEKRDEAARYAADPSPDPANYPILSASIGIEGESLAAIVALVDATRAAWTAIAAHVERKRLGAKLAIDEAVDGAALVAAKTVDWSDGL